MKKAFILLALFGVPLGLSANELTLGGQFWTWNINPYTTYQAQEFYLPVSISVQPTKNLTLYAQTEAAFDFLIYKSPYPNANSTRSALSDTTAGGKIVIPFLDGGDVFVNLGFNLPTGSSNFRNNQMYLDAQLVDIRYQAVTFGIGAMAGVDLPTADGQFTLAAGYMDPNVFNPTFGIPQGNSLYSQYQSTLFSSAAYTQNLEGGSTQAFSLWAMFHDHLGFTSQYGASFDLDYRLSVEKVFSINAGAQLFTSNQYRQVIFTPGPFPYFYVSYGPFVTEAHNSRGPRLYADPSLTFGQVTLEGQIHHIFSNDYTIKDYSYDGGGWLLGLGPLWKIALSGRSDLSLSGSFTKLIRTDGALNSTGNRVDFAYDLWRLGIEYAFHF